MKVPFSWEELGSYLQDAEVAALSLSAMASVREGSLVSFGEAAAKDGPGRKAAFAASVQGLAPRLDMLPGGESLPEGLRSHIGEDAVRCGARGRRIVGLLEEVRPILAEAGIAAVPLKGAALVLHGLVEAGLRPMADLDFLLLDARQVEAAGDLLSRRLGYHRLWNTRRHLVLAEEAEQVPLPACEHPANPLRIELHRSFRLEVLGSTLDATTTLRSELEECRGWQVPRQEALLEHLVYHAAEDFAAKGLRGVQAVDFQILAREWGQLPVPEPPPGAAGPLLFAVDGLERLFPGTFVAADVERLAARVSPRHRERAARLTVLRHSRPARGWTTAALSLVDGAVPKTRFFFRTLVPSLDEVKANVAPEAEGLSLALAWLKVLAGRSVSAIRRLRSR